MVAGPVPVEQVEQAQIILIAIERTLSPVFQQSLFARGVVHGLGLAGHGSLESAITVGVLGNIQEQAATLPGQDAPLPAVQRQRQPETFKGEIPDGT